jgi:hypothetical protein
MWLFVFFSVIPKDVDGKTQLTVINLDLSKVSIMNIIVKYRLEFIHTLSMCGVLFGFLFLYITG